MIKRKQLAERLLARAREDSIYAPPVRRLTAFLVDYVISSIFISIVPMLITSIVTGQKVFSATAFAGMPFLWQGVAGAVAVLAGVYYFCAYPMAKAHLGQTPGKQLVKIRICPIHGGELAWGHMLRRELIGSLVVEGETAFPSTFVRYFFYLVIPGGIAGRIAEAAVILSVISVLWAVFHEQHRMFHDYVGGTMVVKA